MTYSNTTINQPGQTFELEPHASLSGFIKALCYNVIFLFILVGIYTLTLNVHRYAIYDFAAIVVGAFLYLVIMLATTSSAFITRPFVIHLLNLTVAAMMVYAKYVGYIILETHTLPGNFDPRILYEQTSALITQHPLTLYTVKIHADNLLLIWGIESGIMALFTMLLTKTALEDTIVCFSCRTEINSPTSHRQLTALPDHKSPAYWQQKFSAGDFSAMMNLEYTDTDHEMTHLKLYQCKCKAVNVVSISHCKWRHIMKDGEIEEESDSTDIVKNMVISQRNYDQLAQL